MTLTVEPTSPPTEGAAPGRVQGDTSESVARPETPGFATVVRQGLLVFVAFCVALTAFLFVGTAFVHNREQASLQREFRSAAEVFGLPPQFTTNADGSLGAAKPIPTGEAVAWMRIPSVGVSEVVVEGTTSSQTLRGPGHVRSTPLPGQFGNAVVICRRVAGGGPCSDLDELRNGQEITFTTSFGEVTYRVFATGVAKPSDSRIFNTLTTGSGPNAHNMNTVTVVTSDPAVVASDRYVVQAELVGEAKNFTPSQFQVRAEELGLAGEHQAWLPLLLSLQFLLAVSIGAVWLFRRWNRRGAWIIATPIVLFAVWLTCEQFIRVLPAAL